MVSSNLIDIEVIMKDNNHIRTKMIVDKTYLKFSLIFKIIKEKL